MNEHEFESALADDPTNDNMYGNSENGGYEYDAVDDFPHDIGDSTTDGLIAYRVLQSLSSMWQLSRMLKYPIDRTALVNTLGAFFNRVSFSDTYFSPRGDCISITFNDLRDSIYIPVPRNLTEAQLDRVYNSEPETYSDRLIEIVRVLRELFPHDSIFEYRDGKELATIQSVEQLCARFGK